MATFSPPKPLTERITDALRTLNEARALGQQPLIEAAERVLQRAARPLPTLQAEGVKAMPVAQAGGYRLTDRAQSEAQLRGLSQADIQHILANTIDQEIMPNDLWMVTDGRNTAILSPLDSVITSVIRGSRKTSRR
jgi:hypothetical protein